MTEQARTPPNLRAPWRYDNWKGVGEGFILNADGNVVGQVRGWGWRQKEPNPEQLQDAHGHALAAAAEALEACRAMAAWSAAEKAGPNYGEHNRHTHPNGGDIRRLWWLDQVQLFERAVKKAHAAIAKAEGRV